MTTGVLSGPMPGDFDAGGTPPRAVPVHRPDLYDRLVGALLVLFLTFLGAFLRSFGIPNRMEDVVFVLLVPFAYRYLPQRKNILFWLIVGYFSLSLFPYLAGFIARDYMYGVYPIVAIKEMQYFYIAFLVCQNRSKWVLGYVDAMCVLLVLNGVRLIASGSIDYYGIGTMATFQSPSMAGALYLFGTVWLHIRSRLLPSLPLRLAAMGLVLVGAVCVVATVSRSSIGALAVYAVVYMVLSLNVLALGGFAGAVGLAPKVVQTIAFLASAGGAVGIAEIAGRLVRRWSIAGLSSGAERTGKWGYYLDMLELPEWLIGRGKGFPNALDGTFGMGIDSQYVRTILEMGVLGLILTAAILLRMLYTIQVRRGEWQHAFALVAAMLVLSLPMEAFQVAKSGGFFWLLMFYLYFCQRQVPRGARMA
jgi:hypothetical protein